MLNHLKVPTCSTGGIWPQWPKVNVEMALSTIFICFSHAMSRARCYHKGKPLNRFWKSSSQFIQPNVLICSPRRTCNSYHWEIIGCFGKTSETQSRVEIAASSFMQVIDPQKRWCSGHVPIFGLWNPCFRKFPASTISGFLILLDSDHARWGNIPHASLSDLYVCGNISRWAYWMVRAVSAIHSVNNLTKIHRARLQGGTLSTMHIWPVEMQAATLHRLEAGQAVEWIFLSYQMFLCQGYRYLWSYCHCWSSLLRSKSIVCLEARDCRYPLQDHDRSPPC